MILIFTFLQSIHCSFVVNMLSIHCWSQIVKVLLLKPAPSMSNMNYWIFKMWRICQKETYIFLSSPSFERGSNTIFFWKFFLYCFTIQITKMLPYRILITRDLGIISVFSFYYMKVFVPFQFILASLSNAVPEKWRLLS